eukprot:Em0009g358a
MHKMSAALQDKEVNTGNIQLWKDGQAKVMIVTSAFGLGVDYSPVRNVICFGLPYSLEDFMKVTGRAGRDDVSCSHMESCELCHVCKKSTQTTAVVESVDSRDEYFWNSIPGDETLGVAEDPCTIELADNSSWTPPIVKG